ncbi:MAG: dihydroorotase [Dongiaceae bacterium]
MLKARLDLLIKGGRVVTAQGVQLIDIGVTDGKIAAVGSGEIATQIFDAKGLHILPGVIDTHIHCREPGNTHKEDFSTSTMAAIMGGVATVFDMPNNATPTTGAAELAEKRDLIKGRAYCDYGFFIGASPGNIKNLGELERLPGCAGVKVYMGSTTGSLLVSEDPMVEGVLRHTKRLVAFHAEDEPRLIDRKKIAETSHDVRDHPNWRDAKTALLATQRVINIAQDLRRRVHILHCTSKDEMEFLRKYKDIAAIEVTPQHLTLYAPDCYERLGTLAQMNPPIRDINHQQALWDAVRDGIVDTIGSDHAPHTLEEKAKPYPQSPSGMPGVQTLVPVMLNHVNNGKLSLERLVDLTSAGPARLYGLKNKGQIALGYDADFTIVDLSRKTKITRAWICSKCGWSPFEGMEVTGWPIATILRGDIVMQEGEIIGEPKGEMVSFA